jgi:hypothetical protein
MAKILLRSITPKGKIFDLSQFDRQMSNALNDVIQTAKRDFEKTVATWSNKPQFDVRRASAAKLEAKVSTTHEIFTYVVRGTKPHTITARRAPALRFQTGFTSKTMPRKITSRRGGRSGPMVSAKTVYHPGTEARDFDIVIAEKLKPVLVKEVRNAIKRATS